MSNEIVNSNQSKMKALIGLMSALALSGCGSTLQLYEGGGDYRFIDAKSSIKSTSEITRNERRSEGWYADWIDKYQSRDQRANMKDKFKEGDTISIYLKSAMFSYITESMAERAWANHVRKSGKVTGQIAIVANIAVDQGLEPLVSPADVSNPGRVIFYSGDVEEGQMVNQSFGPVYGPVKWNGGPIVLDVTVLEIDEEERQQTGAVIGSLAKLGTVPGVSFSPTALSLLNTLGSALVQSNRDDVMGRFRLTLTPDVRGSAAYLPTLQEGDLVLIRKSTRDFVYPWRQDCSHLPAHKQEEGTKIPEQCAWHSSYNPGTGHFAPSNSAANLTNYMVFTFVKNMPGPNLSPNTTTEQLLEKIKTSNSTNIAESLSDYVKAKQKDAAWDQAQRKISQLAEPSTSTFYREFVARDIAFTAQCIMLHRSAQAVDKSATDATKIYCRSGETFNDQFSPSDYDILARRLGEVCESGSKPVKDLSSVFSRSALLGSAPLDFTRLAGVIGTNVDIAAAKIATCGVQ